MFKFRYLSVCILIVAAGIGWFVWHEQHAHGQFAFKLGLDLSGGSHLEYIADTSAVKPSQVGDSLAALQTVIERRVNAFGVGEPVIQTERGGVTGAGDQRLVVELPGVTDVNQAIDTIGKTPSLEFKLVNKGMEASTTMPLTIGSSTITVINQGAFAETGLTGALLSSARVDFSSGSGAAYASQPVVAVTFNPQGTKLFGDITSQNIGRSMAIFLDGTPISIPVIRDAITNGSATISGNFTVESAKELANSLNLGALPVPITLAGTQTVGATLGTEAVHAGVRAALLGLILLSIFLILWYRLPGFVAVVALAIYVAIMLAIFQLVPVVLTAAGIAGFILSIGLAVDANILIAERMKEEIASGKHSTAAIRDGFARAWTAIRDANTAHIIAAIVLFIFGTSIVKGFALVFGLGVLISFLSAITVSRTFLLALGVDSSKPFGRFLMGSGFVSTKPAGK